MRAPGGAGPALYWNEIQTARAPRGSVRRVTDRDSTGGVQPRAASRTGMVELQATARTGTEQSPDASPPSSGRGNKVLLRIPSDHPPHLTSRPRWSTAAQHPGGKLLHQPRRSSRACLALPSVGSTAYPIGPGRQCHSSAN